MDLYEGLPEPVAKAWERGLTSGRAAMSRRRLLRAASLAAAGSTLVACGIPPAAGSKGGEGAEEPPDYSKKEKVLNFANWPLYVDVDERNKKKHPTLDRFARESGIKVKYVEDINDNNEFYGKIKPQLAAGQSTGRDLICLSDWMAGRLIRQGYVQRLDPANMTHAVTNLEDRFRAAAHDPGRQYSYPWAGTACIVAYNKKATKGKKITSVTQLLEDDALKGRISMLTEMTDTVGLTMLDMGADSEHFTEDQFDAAIARIQKAVDRKQLRRFSGNDYLDELNSGDIAACLAWAGDIVQLRMDNDDIAFAVPDRGYLFGTDDLLVPAKARHQSNAEALIDYYYRPDVAAQLAAWVNYICPVTGAKAEMEKIDEELADDPLVFPDQDMIAKGKNFRPMSAKEEARYEEKFSKLIGA
ncbi:spermidine/putrescine ABC transporter substrate-binding protein [Streptomyces tubbatahanensis]|uniref:Spermidine/putrescine ABC transporter substrate-binding protein n=1 Tax=Streptomyces tubbatahanensis TaxID=2923272 RepID=A0ABY3XXU7_9ACTN|nr:spermidine/putrescine ABC transporter substrate-binding protein [Streptomyces tubbatahanensis]UNS99292.1 spermidine/putrescine ABC transporter substrate-binding protein [Streptomyces tubbatahanensis]